MFSEVRVVVLNDHQRFRFCSFKDWFEDVEAEAAAVNDRVDVLVKFHYAKLRETWHFSGTKSRPRIRGIDYHLTLIRRTVEVVVR